MNLQTAFDLLLVTPVESDAPLMAVVCDGDLPDGSWQEFASALRVIPDAPPLLVACNDPRGLWIDVVRSGGFDVVLKPFERGEITWALTTAWCHWNDRATRARARAKSNGHLHGGF
jgi:FixJ family two-component response regulator